MVDTLTYISDVFSRIILTISARKLVMGTIMIDQIMGVMIDHDLIEGTL